MRRRNPGFLNTGIQLTDLALVAGAGWLLLSDQGKALRDALFPSSSQAPGPQNTGGPGGQNSAVLPATAFRLQQPTYSLFIRRGGPIDITWHVQHQGPAGSYVLGLAISPAHPLCVFGQHSQEMAVMEAALAVGDDAGWTDYQASTSQSYQVRAQTIFDFLGHLVGMDWVGSLDVRVYVRNELGVLLAQEWRCSQINVGEF